MNERLKTHSKTQKKSADLVSNKLRIGVFHRYQMKCKSVSKKSPRYKLKHKAAQTDVVQSEADANRNMTEGGRDLMKSVGKAEENKSDSWFN
ncbi:DUF5384 family protein [Escherichia coli]|nr:hypothetical protein [Escherichia coli]EHA9779386.1 hypothetical protein [Escherichia coli]EHA9980876.1 hypothetical protein [Escherichia coli]